MDTVNFWNQEVDEMRKLQKKMEDDLEKRLQQVIQEC